MHDAAVPSDVVARLDELDAVAAVDVTPASEYETSPTELSIRLSRTFTEDTVEVFGKRLHDELATVSQRAVMTSIEYPRRLDSSGVVRPDYNHPELVVRLADDAAALSTDAHGYTIRSTTEGRTET